MVIRMSGASPTEQTEEPGGDADFSQAALTYDELRGIARRLLSGFPPGQTLTATALAHEAITRLDGKSDRDWEHRRQYIAAATVTMRNILVDAARRRVVRARRIHDVGRSTGPSPDGFGFDLAGANHVLRVDDALNVLRQIDTRASQVVEMKFFGSMAERDISLQLGVSMRTIRRDWAFAKAWLLEYIDNPDSGDDDSA